MIERDNAYNAVDRHEVSTQKAKEEAKRVRSHLKISKTKPSRSQCNPCCIELCLSLTNSYVRDRSGSMLIYARDISRVLV